MPKIFDSIRAKKPRYNKFDLSHDRKMSIQQGYLYPCYLQDIIPGDEFRVQSEVFMRVAPMLAPIMHQMDVFVHYFFVPNRLVWDEWEDFIIGGEDGLAAPVAPRITLDSEGVVQQFKPRTLADYLGCPVVPNDYVGDPTNPISVSALPFRAYSLIWNEYFRDQNLTDEIAFPKTSGVDLFTYNLQLRCWEKDYFTSALPFAQRGPDVNIPISEAELDIQYEDVSRVIRNDTDTILQNADLGTNVSGQVQGITGSILSRIENIASATVTGIEATINDLRRAMSLQRWLEKSARGGSRYTEQIWQHYGVRSSDARLQRPEYLGGGKTPVTISEVVSTYQDPTPDTGNPQGNMAGHGISIGQTNTFSKTFEEHGYVMGVMSIRPRTAYMQGLPRHFSRFDKFDYFWPDFAHIGEQEVKLREIWWDPDAVTPDENDTFGYQSRYSEYKFGLSSVHGEFRDTLSFWHMARIFDTKPQLNTAFVSQTPIDRIFAVQGETDRPDYFYMHIYNKVDALRMMPVFGTPY